MASAKNPMGLDSRICHPPIRRHAREQETRQTPRRCCPGEGNVPAYPAGPELLGRPRNNPACRGERVKSVALYESLTADEREKVPQVLRVWLRYRSEKYFGEGRTPPGSGRK